MVTSEPDPEPEPDSQSDNFLGAVQINVTAATPMVEDAEKRFMPKGSADEPKTSATTDEPEPEHVKETAKENGTKKKDDHIASNLHNSLAENIKTKEQANSFMTLVRSL